MKILSTLCLLMPMTAMASLSPVTPQNLHISIEKSGAATTVQQLDEKGIERVSKGIADADPQWLKILPELAGGLEGGNAENIIIALATALPKNTPAVLALMATAEISALPGQEKICSMPFADADDATLARYFLQTDRALKKAGKSGINCLNTLNQAMNTLKTGAVAEQKYALNRHPMTPERLWQAVKKDGVDEVAKKLSDKQRLAINEGISRGDREWLYLASSLADSKDPKMHSDLLVSLATALPNNPGDVLKAAQGHFEIDLLCAMPFPKASPVMLKSYYQKTQAALKKIRKRGEPCLAVLTQEQSLMVKTNTPDVVR